MAFGLLLGDDKQCTAIYSDAIIDLFRPSARRRTGAGDSDHTSVRRDRAQTAPSPDYSGMAGPPRPSAEADRRAAEIGLWPLRHSLWTG